MRVLHDRWSDNARPDTLLVFLPPAHSTAEDLIAQGFVAAVRERQLAVDILLPDPGYAPVMAGTVAAELHARAIAPALAAGYRHLWLAGISLGAFNALHYAAARHAPAAGLVLIAPYPGTADILNEIRAAGGPATWAEHPASKDDDERIWWKWLYRCARDKVPAPAVHLLLGAQDRFADGQALLAELIDPACIDRRPGGHDWPVWLDLWQRWLDAGHLADKKGMAT
jgi:pimeloyl-ACP methyl ester carboxylesterase